MGLYRTQLKSQYLKSGDGKFISRKSSFTIQQVQDQSVLPGTLAQNKKCKQGIQ